MPKPVHQLQYIIVAILNIQLNKIEMELKIIIHLSFVKFHYIILKF